MLSNHGQGSDACIQKTKVCVRVLFNHVAGLVNVKGRRSWSKAKTQAGGGRLLLLLKRAEVASAVCWRGRRRCKSTPSHPNHGRKHVLRLSTVFKRWRGS